MAILNNRSILLVTTSFPLSRDDVSGIFVKKLADALADKSKIRVILPCSSRSEDLDVHNYSVTCFRYAPRALQRLAHEPGGIPVTLKSKPFFWLLVPVFLLRMFLAVLHSGRQVDVIHANWLITGLICGLAGKLLRKPVVTTLRGADVAKLEYSALSRAVLRLTLKLNEYLITVSTPMQKRLHRLFPTYIEQITHIPNGVENRLFELPLSCPTNSRLRLVSIGSLIPRKGISSIINALQDVPDFVSLTVVGDGKLRRGLENQARSASLCSRVHFLGTCPPERIASVLADHDALVLASSSEGRPNVVVEAMAAGRAVLASNLPGVQELIVDNHNGLLFDANNDRQIRNVIQALANNPRKATELGANARQTILQKGLSWEVCAERYLQVFYQALSH